MSTPSLADQTEETIKEIDCLLADIGPEGVKLALMKQNLILLATLADIQQETLGLLKLMHHEKGMAKREGS